MVMWWKLGMMSLSEVTEEIPRLQYFLLLVIFVSVPRRSLRRYEIRKSTIRPTGFAISKGKIAFWDRS